MPYNIIDGKLVRANTENTLSVSSSKRELFNALKEQVDRAESAEQRAAQLEAERDMYKDGFDALTTANEQIVKERDELRAALSREEYKRMVAESKIKELEDSDTHFSRAMSEALNEGDGVYRP